ncbi:MAG: hypothetical protein ONB48_19405 [candidate division KSB1 bacterium]|nr:hypothetical protein [candidate division KSB1 bacterium]MDZ7274142.1 hypothetical protein [candidate division KSB1 bacterium]MDZ7287813.1 hypothetical protein [candidate division KSB1 bacterium]MDZ7296741.1 hypothetical protein [candidate division KSB1 bacterium]MDZ7347607.1 hypothetical protein [candidate division KSB1 bacterium]
MPVLAGGNQIATSAAGEYVRDSATHVGPLVPVALVGRWCSGFLSTTNFYDATAQRWCAPQGTGLFLTVQADGAYCLGGGAIVPGEKSINYYFYQEGTLTTNGTQMVITPFTGTGYTRRSGTAPRVEQWLAAENELQPCAFQFQIVAASRASSSATLILINEQGEQINLRLNIE